MIRPDQLKREIDNLLARFPELTEDVELMADTLEGQTDFTAVMSTLVRKDMEAKALAEGLASSVKELAAQLEKRAARFKQQSEWARSLMQTFMDQSGQKKVVLPEATISFRNVAPGVVITDEAIIPDNYVVTTSRPDMKAIKAAIDAGENVRGAALGNAKMTISVRYS